MAATVRVSLFTGTTGQTQTHLDNEGGGANLRHNRDEGNAGTTAVPIPTATGTNYSWRKYLALFVSTADAGTAILNRRIRQASAPATGLIVGYLTTATYTQQTATPDPVAGGTPPTVLSGMAAVPTTDTQYDNTLVNADAGRNGDFTVLSVGVGSNYAGGAGSPSLPALTYTYDEQPR